MRVNDTDTSWFLRSDGVRDRTLIALVWLVLLFSALHTGDHVVRENLGRPLTPASITSLMVSAFIFVLVGLGLYLYTRGIIGPRIWVIAGCLGFVFGMLAHLSPFTDQTVRSIAAAYDTKVRGWLAASVFVGLMASMLATTLYATHLSRKAV